MGATIIGVNDPKTVKKYSVFLAVESIPKSYWLSKFMGKYQKKGSNKPIVMITDLEKEAGDKASYDLVMQIGGYGVEGDDTLEGKETNLVFYTDGVLIDQFRHGVNTGGKMTKKRTKHNLRSVARERSSGYMGQWYDEQFFANLSGSRGVDTTWKTLPLGWTGRAGNALTAPDANHILYGGNATQKSDLDANDKFDLALIDAAVAHVETTDPEIQPIMIDGEEHYVCVMHSFQARDLRTNTSTGQWLDIQKAVGQRGKDNPIFRNSLGMYNNVILHKHRRVVRFNDYGSGSVEAARALFFGAQAGVVAFGNAGNGLRFSWHEELVDRGNVLVVDFGSIVGIKKCTFNSTDFGVVALDTACKK